MKRPSEIEALVAHFGHKSAVEEAANGWSSYCPVSLDGNGRYCGTPMVVVAWFSVFFSEADTAVWLPKERVLFSASGIVVDQINIFRPFVTIPDILAAAKMMKALNPEHVIPGHGNPAR